MPGAAFPTTQKVNIADFCTNCYEKYPLRFPSDTQFLYVYPVGEGLGSPSDSAVFLRVAESSTPTQKDVGIAFYYSRGVKMGRFRT